MKIYHLIIKEELKLYYGLLSELEELGNYINNISMIFYKTYYTSITIDFLPEINVADKYYKTIKELDGYLLQPKYNKMISHNSMIYITENDRNIQLYKREFTNILDKDIKYIAEQLLEIYNYIKTHNLIEKEHIVSNENIKIIFYQILDVIKNNKNKIDKILYIYGDKEAINNKIIDILAN
jgi:hypothetical protein